MALSAYERTLNRFRRALLATEGQARQQLAAAYQRSRRSILRQLERLPDDPTFRRQRLEALVRQIEDEILRLTMEAVLLTEQGQRTMAILGPEHARGLVEAQTPELAASFVQLPRAAFETMVGATGDGTPLRGVLSRYGTIAAAEAAQTLQSAIAEGWGPRETARRLRHILDTMQWEAERIARTEQIRAYRESGRETMRQNRDLVPKYRRLSARDGRVCAVCIALDGTIYDVDRMMPSHVCCRCAQLPIVRGYEGLVPFGETGPEWFDRQDEVTQRRILGDGKAKLYRAGEIRLSDLVHEWDDPTWGPQVAEVPLKALSGELRMTA